jgi:hypothetical protein
MQGRPNCAVRWQERSSAGKAARTRAAPNGLLGAEASQSVIERRAADVLVLGSGPVAQSAAYSLANSGRKVSKRQ